MNPGNLAPHKTTIIGSIGWLVLGITSTIVFSLLFHKIWLAWFSWKILSIPIGLAGLLFPIFFIGPISGFSTVYQLIVQVLLHRHQSPLRIRLIFSFLVPIVLVGVYLFVACPVEGGQSYTRAFFGAIFSRQPK